MSRTPSPANAATTAPLRPGSDATEAVTALLERYGGRIRALALRLCGHAADADDLVQEVFLRAFRKWHTFRGDADPGTWLYTIAVRACSARWRAKGGVNRRVPALSQLLPWRETTVMAAVAERDSSTHAAERDEAIDTVHRNIAALPEHLRVPLLLKEVLELPVHDVAVTLGLTESTVKTRLHRARLALRKAMTSAARPTSAPRPIYDRQVCLDLMKAKLEAMDQGRPFNVPEAELCARCRAVFRELDLVQDACVRMSEGKLPANVRRAVLNAIAQRDADEAGGGRRRGRRPVRPGSAARGA